MYLDTAITDMLQVHKLIQRGDMAVFHIFFFISCNFLIKLLFQCISSIGDYKAMVIYGYCILILDYDRLQFCTKDTQLK